MYQHSLAAEFGIIAVAICNELLATLVAREIITPNDVRDILERSIHEISTVRTAATDRAVTLIEGELLPRFSKNSSQ